MRYQSVCHLVALLILSLPMIVFGQQPVIGLPPLGTFGGGPLDVIDLANLNLHLSIPITNKAGRGIPFSYALTYDSLVWVPTTSGSTTGWTPINSKWGWADVTQVETGYVTYESSRSLNECPYHQGNGPLMYGTIEIDYTGFAYHDPSGAVHPIPGTVAWINDVYAPCGQSHVINIQNQPTTDNSGYIITTNSGYALGPVTVYAPGGVIFTTPNVNATTGDSSVRDNDGNTISMTVSGGTTTFTDTLSLTALTVSGTPASNVQYSYTAPSGAQASYTLTYYNFYVQTCFLVPGISEYSSGSNTVPLPVKLTLPDGTYYQFVYETTVGCGASGKTTGRIAAVSLPTQGIIEYSYSGTCSSNGNYNNDSCMMADGSPSSMSREMVGYGTWNYTRALQPNQDNTTQTVTTSNNPDGSMATMNFSGIYELTNTVTQNSSTLDYQAVCYNGNYTQCQIATVTSPITLRDFYDVPSNGAIESDVEDQYDGYGNVTTEKVYDYSGSVIKQTVIAYDSGLCGSLKICNSPDSITIKDGGGNWKAETAYTYWSDGHVKNESDYTSVGIPLVTGHVWNSNGTLSSMTDPKLTIYTYAYNNQVCNGAFPTSISVPGDGGTTITYNYAYNCTGGVVTQVTDVGNNHWSGAWYTDPYFWRPGYTSDLSGVATYYNYYGVTNQGTGVTLQPGQVESVLTNISGVSAVDQLVTPDTFGRPFLSQQREGPGSSNWDTVEYLYDNSGRISWATLPFQGTVGQVGIVQGDEPAINYNYDGLGRYTSIDGTYWGGVLTTYGYFENDVTISTMAAPAQSRQYEYNALGNLTSVCEITSTTGAGCGQKIGTGKGYLTQYTYDPLGNLTAVTQDSNQSVQQARYYYYDGLSRMTDEYNPESQWAHYTFDSDSAGTCSSSAGDMVKKKDNIGNQTCFSYDQLHRLTDAGLSGPVCRHWRYDTATVNGVQMPNAVGRLATATTDNCGSTQYTVEGYGYDARGGNTDLYESTTHSGGYYHTQAAYWPDGTIQSLTANMTGSGIPNQGYYIQGKGGRIQAVTASSGQNPIDYTVYNAANQLTGTIYGSGDHDTLTFDNLGRLKTATYGVGSQQVGHTLAWNPNGTLSSLSITDPLNSGNVSCNIDTPGQPGSGYDAFGRVTQVSCGSAWQQTFNYDSFGNIKKNGTISWTPSYYVNSGQSYNQYVQGGGIQYDLDGNLLGDTFNTYTWDPNFGNPATVNGNALVYDAQGRMVENTTTSGVQEYVYAPGGSQVLAQMNRQTPVAVQYPLPGGALARYDSSGNLTYARPDWLGSARLVTNSTQTMVSDSGYAPFGEQYSLVNTPSYDFTGQQQWTISGSSAALDDFPFRKYHPVQGRWITPDPAGLAAVDITNPQTWNRYAYVANNPLSYTDPLGLILICGDPNLFADDPFCDANDGGGGGGGGGDGYTFSVTSWGLLDTDPPDIYDGSNGNAITWNLAAFQFGGGGGPVPSNRQIINSALKQKLLHPCSQTLFGNANALTAANAPSIQYISLTQMLKLTGVADAAGAPNPTTNSVYFNSSVFTANLGFIYYQSNYLHEAGNILSFNVYGNYYAKGNMFVGPNEYPVDPDSGASFERCIFGQRMQIP